VGIVTSPPGDVVELDRTPHEEHEADGAALPDHFEERTVSSVTSQAQRE
jgi:hypothetical protein